MDLLTTIIMTAVVVAILARVVEVAARGTGSFAALLDGARPFAEAALAESEALRRFRARPVVLEGGAGSQTEERPALAA